MTAPAASLLIDLPTGCDVPHVALDQAAKLIGQPTCRHDDGYWSAQGRNVLAAFLHAAALANASGETTTTEDVASWVHDPSTHCRRICHLLRDQRTLAEVVGNYATTNGRTRDSIAHVLLLGLMRRPATAPLDYIRAAVARVARWAR